MMKLRRVNRWTCRLVYDTGGKAYHAIRQGDWKLLQNSPYQPLELYNLREDPLETTDVIKQNPAVVRRLNDLLMEYIQESGKVPWQKDN